MTYPLPTLLSQALVAFTIEFDNEAEHQLQHRTTNGRGSSSSGHGPWLVSQVMWANIMQFVGEDGIRVGDLHARARTTKDALPGLQRWGYVTVEPHPNGTVRPTAAGRQAQTIWRPLAGVVEDRWRERLGPDAVDLLRESLAAVVDQVDLALPQYLPIVGYGLFTEAPPDGARRDADGSRPDLSALLARALHAFTIEFESDSEVSLTLCANPLRVMGEDGGRVGELPALTGVSREAIAMALGFLEKRGFATIEPDPSGPRGKVARLTAKGAEAQAAHHRRVASIEEQWRGRFGADRIAALRASLEPLAGAPGDERPPLFEGLTPYPDGWRASARPRATLPHHPAVLHRGGFPDGS